MNLKVRAAASEVFGGCANIHLIEPLSYQPFVNLMAKSYFIITDSGGCRKKLRLWANRCW